jgi:hypothetical protein
LLRIVKRRCTQPAARAQLRVSSIARMLRRQHRAARWSVDGVKRAHLDELPPRCVWGLASGPERASRRASIERWVAGRQSDSPSATADCRHVACSSWQGIERIRAAVDSGAWRACTLRALFGRIWLGYNRSFRRTNLLIVACGGPPPARRGRVGNERFSLAWSW